MRRNRSAKAKTNPDSILGKIDNVIESFRHERLEARPDAKPAASRFEPVIDHETIGFPTQWQADDAPAMPTSSRWPYVVIGLLLLLAVLVLGWQLGTAGPDAAIDAPAAMAHTMIATPAVLAAPAVSAPSQALPVAAAPAPAALPPPVLPDPTKVASQTTVVTAPKPAKPVATGKSAKPASSAKPAADSHTYSEDITHLVGKGG